MTYEYFRNFSKALHHVLDKHQFATRYYGIPRIDINSVSLLQHGKHQSQQDASAFVNMKATSARHFPTSTTEQHFGI
ncbi:hypothetical protein INT47_013274 [Mucor saturninus]|uniref:Uncharacterized protein n=1 Tax=Mucor saturninus TaxID=64648 RepID=A0A8H7QF81_9FUNG|nr:hypothetical protein INT47_013274 [Mucor saturninus]